MAGFELLILRLECVFEAPLRIARTAQVKLLADAFPHFLRRASCDTPSLDCRSCRRRPGCAYSTVFEPMARDAAAGIEFIEDAGLPFAIRPPGAGGSEARFDLVLAGDAILHTPAMIEAFALLGRAGYGRERLRFRVASVRALDASFSPRSAPVDPSDLRPLASTQPLRTADVIGTVSAAAMKTASIRFVTPPLLRPGKPIERVPFGLMARRVRDRIRIVGLVHCGGEPEIDLRGVAVRADAVTLAPRPRGSGSDVIEYFGPLHDLVPMLRLGAVLNIGEWCAYGQGWYDVARQ
ncbi:MAG: hypothetical protein HY897_16680 [Deltaproteobacteria bacterium]|nr:hypothetical protein [Deltaproteobacteria bacterium]